MSLNRRREYETKFFVVGVETGLLDSDVDQFTDRATELRENLDTLADIVEKTP